MGSDVSLSYEDARRILDASKDPGGGWAEWGCQTHSHPQFPTGFYWGSPSLGSPGTGSVYDHSWALLSSRTNLCVLQFHTPPPPHSAVAPELGVPTPVPLPCCKVDVCIRRALGRLSSSKPLLLPVKGSSGEPCARPGLPNTHMGTSQLCPQ